MSDEEPENDENEDVSVDDDTVEESDIEVDVDATEDLSVDEELEAEDDELTERTAIEEGDEETTVAEDDISVEDGDRPFSKGRERLEAEADKAVDQFDQSIVDLLSWVLDTETRARIFVYLRKYPGSTSEEVAEGTGLYPSTVRESLAELHSEDKVERRKRASEGAGNNPYEYTAIAPSDLVGGVVGQIQDELNTVFNLDDHIGGRADDFEPERDTEPVSIQVEEETSDDDSDSGGEGDADGDDADSPDADEDES